MISGMFFLNIEILECMIKRPIGPKDYSIEMTSSSPLLYIITCCSCELLFLLMTVVLAWFPMITLLYLHMQFLHFLLKHWTPKSDRLNIRHVQITVPVSKMFLALPKIHKLTCLQPKKANSLSLYTHTEGMKGSHTKFCCMKLAHLVKRL